jgi:hypothetical protein
MTDKREKATKQVLEHVDRAQKALSDFHNDAVNANGLRMRPQFQGVALKVAREELARAIAIMDPDEMEIEPVAATAYRFDLRPPWLPTAR